MKSRFISEWRKISDGIGVLRQRVQAGTGEAVAKELGLRHGKLAPSLDQLSGHGRSTAPVRLGDAEHEKLGQD